MEMDSVGMRAGSLVLDATKGGSRIMDGIKPCPNPGCEEKHDVGVTIHSRNLDKANQWPFVMCGSCNMRGAVGPGPGIVSKQDAVTAWNNLPRGDS